MTVVLLGYPFGIGGVVPAGALKAGWEVTAAVA
jgi:hypothetical protein